MIDSKALRAFIESRLEGTDYFLVDLKVTPDNIITVEIDTLGDGALDRCISLTKEIEGAFDRDVEDYELEVGTAGLTSPFKVKGQYLKNIGREVEVLANDGKKYRGELLSCDDNGFVIKYEEKVRPEGAKRPVIQTVERPFAYSDTKRVNYNLKF